jgi:hypothetical protein
MDLLFNKRLGHDLYRPVGMEWVTRGFWFVSDLQPTMDAYLKPGGEHWLHEDGFWRWRDNSAELEHKCMTWDQFMAADVDLIVATHPAHEVCFHRLWKEHKPGAKYIRVAGNVSEVLTGDCTRNLMDSTGAFKGRVPNYVAFHQEFPLGPFVETSPPDNVVVSQYLNFFHKTTTRHYWDTYRPHFPDWTWRIYGHQGDDGFLWPFYKIAEAMLASSYVWHIKGEHASRTMWASLRETFCRMVRPVWT